jgi:hypothetical protein
MLKFMISKYAKNRLKNQIFSLLKNSFLGIIIFFLYLSKNF